VPAGRLERLARFGLLAGEVAIGGLTEAAKRMTGTGTADNSVFVTATNARKLAERLSNMRGAAMKLGQLLSLEGQDFLPAEVADALSILRAEGDSMPEAQLRKVLARNYGKQWERRFLTFGMDPIAAASIGQVHHAIAADGRELALKIQYPGVDQSIESDVDNMASILKLSRLLPGKVDISGIIAEAKRQLRQECDYKAEARHLRRYAEMLGDEPGVVIPRVYDDLTTAHILYRLPDFRSILQTYIWQEYDLSPEFPTLKRFLSFWEREIEGPLYSVTIAHRKLIKPSDFGNSEVFHLH